MGVIVERPIVYLSVLLICSMAGFSVSNARAEASYALSERDLYRALYESEQIPIPLNRMQRWVITLETVEGQPLQHAAISVSGAMLDHDHGLPSAPRMTAELGAGRYLLEGLKFHMSGRWVVVLQVSHRLGDDRIVFEVDVQ